MAALTAWRWWNLTETLVPANKQPLRLNLDETPVRCYYADVVRPGSDSDADAAEDT